MRAEAAATGEGEERQPPRGPGLGGAAAGVGALLLGLLAKAKGALFLVKAVPLGKLLLTAGSLFVSILAYASRGGVAYAAGLMLLVLLHELGHGAAMKHHKVPAGWPVFIPFFGAFIAMHETPQDPRVEAEIAYGGPLAGTAASLLCAGIGLWGHSGFFLALSYAGFFLNLFNLVPFGFLDGGRVARLLSRKAWIAGAVLMAGLFFVSPTPQLLLIGGMGLFHSLRRQSEPASPLVTDEDRTTWAVRYFGLCGFLLGCTYFAHRLTQQHGW